MEELSSTEAGTAGRQPSDPVRHLSEAEWRSRLTPQQYKVLREGATDRPFAGPYTHPGADGLFLCAACGAELFDSATQFDSGCGWPSFTSAADDEAVELLEDSSLGMRRTEVRCRACGGHLGHLFDDGPGPTGARWCINSSSLRLASKTAKAQGQEAAAVDGGT